MVVAGSIAIGLASGVAAAASPSPSAQPGVTLAGRGADLFLTSCAACHGSQGAGTAKGPDIRNAGPALADFMLRTGRMPLADPGAPPRRGTPAFSDADRAALVAFVASLGQGPATPNVVTSGADLAAGRNLFVANCAACHGPGGGGGAVGGGFVAPALDQADATTVGEAVVSGPGPMPRFSFTPDQLNNLAAYVLSLRDAPHPGGATSPAMGPVTEGFIAGLTLLALLLTARWVAVRRAHEAAAEPLPMSTDEGAQTGPGRVGDGE
jgi:ubiquinol-cytochrome c reductase cytochrome c subunit